MSKCELIKIPDEHLSKVWPLIRHWVKKIADSSHGRLEVYPMIKKVIDKDWQLWVVWKKEEGQETGDVKAVVFTEMYTDLSGIQVAAIKATVGEDRDEWVELLEVIEGWAKSQGCGILETWARPGWEKILKEYKRTHVLLEKRLEDGVERKESHHNGSGEHDSRSVRV